MTRIRRRLATLTVDNAGLALQRTTAIDYVADEATWHRTPQLKQQTPPAAMASGNKTEGQDGDR